MPPSHCHGSRSPQLTFRPRGAAKRAMWAASGRETDEGMPSGLGARPGLARQSRRQSCSREGATLAYTPRSRRGGRAQLPPYAPPGVHRSRARGQHVVCAICRRLPRRRLLEGRRRQRCSALRARCTAPMSPRSAAARARRATRHTHSLWARMMQLRKGARLEASECASTACARMLDACETRGARRHRLGGAGLRPSTREAYGRRRPTGQTQRPS